VRRRQWFGARRCMVGVIAAGVALALAAGPAQADAIDDTDVATAEFIAVRIGQLNATAGYAAAALPDARAATATAVTNAASAAAAELQVLGGLAVPLESTPGHVVDAAAVAILGDLTPERARAAHAVAEQAVVTTAAHVAELEATVSGALDERGRLLTDLETGGQVLTRWSIDLLGRLDAPVTIDNVRALAAWVGAEQNNVRFRNPLATTMGAPGARDVNDHGVKAYPSDEVGLDATVRTLRNGSYDEIVTALQQGDSAVRVVVAVAISPWGTGANAIRRLALDRH